MAVLIENLSTRITKDAASYSVDVSINFIGIAFTVTVADLDLGLTAGELVSLQTIISIMQTKAVAKLKADAGIP